MTYLMKQRRRRRARPAMHGLGGTLSDLISTVSGGLIQYDDSDADPSDNVTQTVTGTSTSAADFTTTAAGVCKPQNFPALKAVQEFQRQLNRVAQVKGFTKVAPDGSVGPATMTLFAQVQNASSGLVMGSQGSCMGVAPDVDVLAVQVQGFADSLGAPAQVSSPSPATHPTIVTKSNKEIEAPQDLLANVSTVEKLALLGVAGAIGYLIYTS
jgi:hypothetical protein